MRKSTRLKILENDFSRLRLEFWELQADVKLLQKHKDNVYKELDKLHKENKERQEMATLEDVLKHFGTFYQQDDSQEFLDETVKKIKDVLGQ